MLNINFGLIKKIIWTDVCTEGTSKTRVGSVWQTYNSDQQKCYKKSLCKGRLQFIIFFGYNIFGGA